MSSIAKTSPSGRTSAEDKAAQTTAAAHAIIDAEASARKRKTARLKAMRLKSEAEKPDEEKRSPSRGRKKQAAKD
jgi:hypothetical protein